MKRTTYRRAAGGAFALSLAFAVPSIAFANEQKIGDPPEAHNMALVGYDDLQGRSAYQPTIHHQGNRWIAYVGHHGGTNKVPEPVNPLTGKAEYNGTSIVDVTDPHHPKYLFHIPGSKGLYERGGAQMVRVCDGATLPHADKNKTYMLRTFGNEAQEIWDVTNPSAPKLVTRLAGLKGTHKNFWECDTGVGLLVSGVPGWHARRMTQVYDLSDPAEPVLIRNFGRVGQEPGAKGPEPMHLHGAISAGPKANRIYFGYGTNSKGTMQIVDRKKLLEGPKEPTAKNLMYAEVSHLDLPQSVGAHTTFPMLHMKIGEFAKDKKGQYRDFVVIVDEEQANECGEARQMVWFVDVTEEKRPFGVSNFYVPEKERDYCSRGGRFGAHSSNENMTPIYYEKVMFFSYFNAGVRAVDVRNPYRPVEIGYFIPGITKNTDERCVKVDGQNRCKVAIQTNNVEVDDRGYVYIVDRANTGMHILELTGDARTAANLPN